MRRVLITGGAGFIGSHLADALVARGDAVRTLDCLDPQVHGRTIRPAYLADDVELIVGDVRDGAAVERALAGIDVVCHLAAVVGVGQSMYQIDRYVSTNDVGTATLLQAITRHGQVQRLIVASSMSVYGEGLYVNGAGEPTLAGPRTAAQLRVGEWDVRGADGEPLYPLPTPEDKPVALASVYATTKYAQERLCLSVGDAYGLPTIALRFFNVYGSRQALSNPYTGVLAIFASRLLNGRRPLVYEDGLQQRDFVSVDDVVQACLLAIDAPPEVTGVFNIGSGQAVTVHEVAQRLAETLGVPHLAPEITGRFRAGDIRHCVADISAARRTLGYEPRQTIAGALPALAAWLDTQQADDRSSQAVEELAARGLTA